MIFKNLQVLNNFAKHNIKYIDKINIEIFNPKTVYKGSIFRENNYVAYIHFKNDNMSLYKHVDAETIEILMEKMDKIISNEIKL